MKDDVGTSVRRQEAIALLKEILVSCRVLNPKHVALTPSNNAADFELHIKDHFDDKDWNCLKGIIQKHDLNMKETDGFIIIYS